MMKWIITAAVALIPTVAFGGSADGVWKTGAGEDGGYLEVTIAACASDGGKSCGTISGAYTDKGKNPKYVNLGKLIIKDMEPDGDTKFSGGTIWDPEEDKTYKSKLVVNGNSLQVDGCILFICKDQHWTRVK